MLYKKAMKYLTFAILKKRIIFQELPISEHVGREIIIVGFIKADNFFHRIRPFVCKQMWLV